MTRVRYVVRLGVTQLTFLTALLFEVFLFLFYQFNAF